MKFRGRSSSPAQKAVWVSQLKGNDDLQNVAGFHNPLPSFCWQLLEFRAARYPFCSALGIDLKYRGGYSWGGVNLGEKAEYSMP